MAEERALGLDRADYYRAFGRRVDHAAGRIEGAARQAQGPGLPDRGLWRLGQGERLAQRLRHRPRRDRFCGRPQRGQTGALHAGGSPGGPFARQADRDPARLCVCCWTGTRPTRFWPGTSAIANRAATSSSPFRSSAWPEGRLLALTAGRAASRLFWRAAASHCRPGHAQQRPASRTTADGSGSAVTLHVVQAEIAGIVVCRELQSGDRVDRHRGEGVFECKRAAARLVCEKSEVPSNVTDRSLRSAPSL